MTISMNPSFTFDGSCREAITYYHSVFGGKLTITTFGEAGVEGLPSDGVFHANLTTDDDLVIMANDASPGFPLVTTNSTSLSLVGDDASRLRGLFAAFARDGEVTVPLEQQAWGDVYGVVADRFGVSWQVNIYSPRTP